MLANKLSNVRSSQPPQRRAGEYADVVRRHTRKRAADLMRD